MICSVCKTKPVTVRGASTCSLRCATIWDNLCAAKQGRDSDPYEVIEKRLPVKTKLPDQANKIENICISERERLQREWHRANPGCFK